MEILRVIAVWLLGIMMLFLMVCLLLPDEVHLRSSAVVKAPAKQVWPQIRYFRNWSEWFSISGEDSLKHEISGDDGRQGAELRWIMPEGQEVFAELRHRKSSNREWITVQYESVPQSLKYQIHFTLNEDSDSTEILLEMRYRLPFFRRFEALFAGNDLQVQLELSMKSLVQRVNVFPFIDPGQVEQESFYGMTYAYLKDTLKGSQLTPAWMKEKQGFLSEWLKDEGFKANDKSVLLVFAPDSTEKWELGLAAPLKGIVKQGIDSLADTLRLEDYQVKRYPEWTENLNPVSLNEVFRYLSALQLQLKEEGLSPVWPAVLGFDPPSNSQTMKVRLYFRQELNDIPAD